MICRSLLFFALFAFLVPVGFSQKMPGKVDRYVKDRNVLKRFYDTRISAEGAARLDRFTADWNKRLDALNFDELSRRDQVDWILLREHLRSQQSAMRAALARTEADAPFLQFVDTVADLDSKRRARAPVDERAWAEQVGKIKGQIQASRKALEKHQKAAEKKDESAAKEDGENVDAKDENASPKTEAQAKPSTEKLPKWRLFEIAGKAKAAEQMLNQWYAHYAQFQPGFEWWLKKPVEDAKRDISEYDKWLREKMAGVKNREEAAPFGEVVGAERLQEQLTYEMIPYTPAELIKRAEKEFEWCAAEMLKASKELGFDTRREGLEHIKDQFVPPGGQEDYVVKQAEEAIVFCDKHDLLTVPQLCRETWRVKMVDEKGQRTLPYAAYGGLNVLVAYATGSMNHEKKLMSMRGNNLHTTRIVTAHEVIPGHHLQGFVQARNKPYRSLFRTPFNIEGWCLYWEMRLWEMEFARGPEDRIGFLFWRMHRCARIIVTLKFHTGKMEPAKMIDFLVDEVGHEREQATAEVRRYIRGGYSPLYQAAYMLGGMQLRSLHRELNVSKPDGMTERDFHDHVLHLGPIPIEMVRASMMPEVELKKKYSPQWKF